PATAAPIDCSPTGLPIGTQIFGPYLEDCTTITFAELLEREFGGFAPAQVTSVAMRTSRRREPQRQRARRRLSLYLVKPVLNGRTGEVTTLPGPIFGAEGSRLGPGR